ncbi:MAG: flippase-like domain-containing protein, partial [Planctomycetes bacterium]|nr:flippase-like domain-containing protein [Planctomycetota bacterium]
PGFLSYLRNLDVGWFVLGAFCYVCTVLIAGARWWWLLRVNGMNVTLTEALRFTWIGVFFNTVFPGSTGGDVIKALYIMKRCPGHRVQALVSVGVDRILGLGSLALLGAICVLFALDQFTEIALGIWGVIVGVGLLGLVSFSRRLRELVRLKWLLNRLPGKLRGALQMVDKAIFFYRDQRAVIALSLVVGIANHVLSVFCVVCLGMAIGVGMPTFEYFVLVPVINIASAIPIAPNGWGFGELLYGYLFAEHGAQHLTDVADAAAAMRTRGVALSILYRSVLTAFSFLAGVLVLLEKDRVTQEDIDREVALEESEAEAAAAKPGADE